MADMNAQDRKSKMEKAEGDRRTDTRYEDRGERGEGGITNRPLDEENDNQERVPDRGETKPGAHAG